MSGKGEEVFALVSFHISHIPLVYEQLTCCLFAISVVRTV